MSGPGRTIRDADRPPALGRPDVKARRAVATDPRHQATVRFDHPELARTYAEALLARLAVQPRRPPQPPALPAWERAIASGWASLSGPEDGPAVLCPAPLTAAADGALAALASLLPEGAIADLDGANLLGERAAAWGQSRRGLRSPGGTCQLYPTADGWIAFNWARPSDQALFPAWLGEACVADESTLRRHLPARTTAELVEQGQTLGLAVAAEQPLRPAPPWQLSGTDRGPTRRDRPLRVLDCSSLWAGPLCAQLLRRSGADVVKLESLQRPDGARRGPASLFQRLNQGKACVQLDFESLEGLAQLRRLFAAADVVIEASRPRALRQLGIDAAHWLDRGTGRTWISIRGYGAADDPEGIQVAFGDDAGVAAGLSHLVSQYGPRWLVGDAIGDPLTGLHAALAGYALVLRGGGMAEVALTDVLRFAATFATLPTVEEWASLMRRAPPCATWPRPRIPQASTAIREAGADNAAVFDRWTC